MSHIFAVAANGTVQISLTTVAPLSTMSLGLSVEFRRQACMVAESAAHIALALTPAVLQFHVLAVCGSVAARRREP